MERYQMAYMTGEEEQSIMQYQYQRLGISG